MLIQGKSSDLKIMKINMIIYISETPAKFFNLRIYLRDHKLLTGFTLRTERLSFEDKTLLLPLSSRGLQ